MRKPSGCASKRVMRFLEYVIIVKIVLRKGISLMSIVITAPTGNIGSHLAELLLAFDRGIYGNEPRTPETTTPTTLQQWASEVLKPALNATNQ